MRASGLMVNDLILLQQGYTDFILRSVQFMESMQA